MVKFLLIATIVFILLFNFGFLNERGEAVYEKGAELISKVTSVEINGKPLNEHSLSELKNLTSEEIDKLDKKFQEVGLPLRIEGDLTDPEVYEKYNQIVTLLGVDVELPKVKGGVIIKRAEDGGAVVEKINKED